MHHARKSPEPDPGPTPCFYVDTANVEDAGETVRVTCYCDGDAAPKFTFVLTRANFYKSLRRAVVQMIPGVLALTERMMS
jgi:hypothetical protein